jgi:hypothetical protein
MTITKMLVEKPPTPFPFKETWQMGKKNTKGWVEMWR